jgi:hypothetical protein
MRFVGRASHFAKGLFDMKSARLFAIAAGFALPIGTPAFANYSSYQVAAPLKIVMPSFSREAQITCRGTGRPFGNYRSCVVTNGSASLRSCNRVCR